MTLGLVMWLRVAIWLMQENGDTDEVIRDRGGQSHTRGGMA